MPGEPINRTSKHQTARKLWGVCAGIALALILLSGCLGLGEDREEPQPTSLAAASTPTARASATVARTPTAKPSATLTSSPTLTVTASPTKTAAPATNTRIPTEASYFTPLPYDAVNPYSDEVPLIAPPAASAEGYDLARLEAKDTISILQELDEYIYKTDSLWFNCRPNLAEGQIPLRTYLGEVFARYPELASDQALLWRDALAAVILLRGEYNDWILEQIEIGLNTGRYAPDNLEKFLDWYGFSIFQAYKPLDNLCGSEQPAALYWVSTNDFYSSGGLLFSVRVMDNDNYDVTSIWQRWLDCASGTDIIEITDHTKNGLPEITLHYGYHSGLFQSFDMSILEYQKDSWVELFPDKLDFGMFGEVAYAAPDNDGIDTIVHSKMIINTGNVDFFYQWDGSQYALHHFEADNELAQFTIWSHEYKHLLPDSVAINDLLKSWDKFENDAFLGSNYRDYLRFMLGMAYAQESDFERARTTLQSLADSPVNSENRLLSQAAQEFLRHYHAPLDIYRACQSAQAKLANWLEPLLKRNEYGYIDSEEYLSILGVDPIAMRARYEICELDNQLNYLIDLFLAENPVSNPIAFLQQAGLNTYHSAELDFDLDGEPDWVTVVESAGTLENSGRTQWVVWAMINTGTDIRVQRLYDLSSFYGDPRSGYFDYRVFAPRALPEPIVVLQTGEVLQIYAMGRDSYGPKLVTLFNDGPVSGFQVTAGETSLDIEIRYRPTFLYGKFSILEAYRWEAARGELEEFDQALEMMLVDGNLEEAIDRLTYIVGEEARLRDPEYTYDPRSLYLLGLAHELAGHEREAVEIYWQLWVDHPGSAYALIARAKLQLRQP